MFLKMFRRLMVMLPAVVFICLPIVSAPETSAAGDSIVMGQDGRISMDLVDARLDAVLSDLSKKAPLQVKGRPGGGDRRTVHFSRLTLEEVLHKLMAGYNYVLFLPPEGHKGATTLTIVGKAEPRAIGPTVETATPVSTPPAAPPVEQQPHARPSTPGAAAPPLSSAHPAQETAPPAQPAPTAAQSAPPAPPAAQPASGRPVVQPPPPGQTVTAEPGQQQATGQAVQPDAVAAATPPGVLPAADSQPEFNPAAWGGRGRHR